MWNVIPDDVKHMIASHLDSRTMLTALAARPTRATIPVFPASSPIYADDDATGTILVEISQYFKSCNVVSFCGESTFDILAILFASPAARFESITLAIYDISNETLYHFCNILSRANRIKLIFNGSMRVSMCERMLSFIEPGCTSLKIENMPASESFLDDLSWTLRRAHTLRTLGVVLGSSSFCRFSPVRIEFDNVREKMKCMTEQMIQSRAAYQRPLCRITLNRKRPDNYAGPTLSQINDRLYKRLDAYSGLNISSLEHYNALKSLGLDARDLSFYSRQLLDNCAYSPPYAMDLLQAIQHSPERNAFHLIDGNVTLTRILEALPDKMDDVIVCVHDNALYLTSGHFSTMQSAHPSMFDAFVDRVIFFLPYLIESNAENYVLVMESISSPRLYDATVAHLSHRMENVKENFTDHVYAYICMATVLATLTRNGVIRIRVDMSPASVEAFTRWISDMVYASVEFGSADQTPRLPVALLSKAQAAIVAFSAMVLPSGESYTLKKQFPPQWKHAHPSNPKKRKTMKGAIEEEISKRQKRT